MSRFISKCANYYITVQAALTIAFVLPFFIKQYPVSLFIVFVIMSNMAYLIFKDFEVVKGQTVLFAISSAFEVAGAICLIFNMFPNKYRFVSTFKYSFSFICFVLILALILSHKEQVENATKNLNIAKMMNDENKNDKSGYHDMVICKDCETNKDIVIPWQDMTMHTLIVGPTGCGKSSLALTPMILQDMQTDIGVILIEPKGDLAEKTYAMGKKFNKDIIYFNPIYPDCPSFNPLYGNEVDVTEAIVTTFQALNNESIAYFKNLNQELLRNSLRVLKRIERAYTNPKTGISTKPATFQRLSELLHDPKVGKQMAQELARIPTYNNDEKLQNQETSNWFTNSYFAAAPNNKAYTDSSAVRTWVRNLILNDYMYKVLNPANGVSDIKFDEILKKGQKICISTAMGELGAMSDYLGYFLLLAIQNSIFKRSSTGENNLVHMYLDEFQRYSSMSFTRTLELARSFGCGVIMATQSRESIALGKGSDGKGFLTVVSTNARNKILFGGITIEEAKVFSEEFGEKEVEDISRGHSEQEFNFANSISGNIRPSTKSETVRKVMKKRYTPEQLIYKKDFFTVTVRTMENGLTMHAREGKCSWIDKKLNQELEQIGSCYRKEQTQKMKEIIKHREEIMNEKFLEYLRNQNSNIRNGQEETPYNPLKMPK